MRAGKTSGSALAQASVCVVVLALSAIVLGQSNSYQRVFPQSKATIEKALKALQPSMAGRLPVLDGFAKPGEHPLDHYERGYYQASVEITPAPNGSLVRITTKVTAWFADPATSNSGYQLLTSNGRLEGDLLDQLEEQLAKTAPEANKTASTAPAPKTPVKSEEPSISAPEPRFPDTDKTFSTSLQQGLSTSAQAPGQKPDASAKTTDPLQTEANNLQEVLKNIAHPKNLVAVRKSGTPVVATPSLSAKPEFLASVHDEFEMLDFNADWVHVRISGLSRGWIWRNSVEMPEGVPDTAARSASAIIPADDIFHVTREETAPFPGDWEPLRSKYVKIISVEKIDENAKDAGPKEKLEYAKFLLEKNYPEISKKAQELQGIVVIFDAADGGMIAATTATLQQWRAGALSDSALWHKCFFDPPETFDSSAPSGGK